ncbi:MAG: MFS transporter [Gammaproteobacteria bacterium]|nr:MFS transporter [Gammaproteobacteria bacterium]
MSLSFSHGYRSVHDNLSSFSNFYTQHILDKYGRKHSLYLAAFVGFLGSGVQALAYVTNRYQLLIIGRILVGMGAGSGVCSQAIFFSEMAPTPIRGTAGSRSAKSFYRRAAMV